MEKLVYLGLMAGSLLFPLILSFDKKVHFYTRWKHLFPAIFITLAVFIVWDVFFTLNGIWSFNKDYVTGFFILHLPFEEWLFFIIVPYASMFIYEVVIAYWGNRLHAPRFGLAITLLLGLFFLLLALLNLGKTYTVVAALFALLFIIIQLVLKSYKRYMTVFYVSFLICLIPKFIVNGVLTRLPVVSYNDLENLGVRINSIPVDDFIYFFGMFLMNITLYEWFKNKGITKQL
jgi:lycopene cyclase domain-containing protein